MAMVATAGADIDLDSKFVIFLIPLRSSYGRTHIARHTAQPSRVHCDTIILTRNTQTRYIITKISALRNVANEINCFYFFKRK